MRGGRGEVPDIEEVRMAREMGVPESDIESTYGDRAACEVWPENWTTVEVWKMVAASQWTVIAGAERVTPAGLRYEAVVPVMVDVFGVPASDRRRMLADIGVMERAALGEMRGGRS